MEPWKIAFIRRFYFSEDQNEKYTDEDVIKHVNNYTASAKASTFSSDRAYCFKAGWDARERMIGREALKEYDSRTEV